MTGACARGASATAIAALLMLTLGCAGSVDTQKRQGSGRAGDAADRSRLDALGGDAGLAAVDATAGGFLYDKQVEAGQDAYERGRAAGRLEHRPPPPPPR